MAVLVVAVVFFMDVKVLIYLVYLEIFCIVLQIPTKYKIDFFAILVNGLIYAVLVDKSQMLQGSSISLLLLVTRYIYCMLGLNIEWSPENKHKMYQVSKYNLPKYPGGYLILHRRLKLNLENAAGKYKKS